MQRQARVLSVTAAARLATGAYKAAMSGNVYERPLRGCMSIYFRLKWHRSQLSECLHIVQGFEMNPEEWIPYKNLGECEAMDVWEKRLGIVDA